MTCTINPDIRYSCSADAMISRLGDEIVILDLKKNVYFVLDEVGTVVWDQLQDGQTPTAICTHVEGSFSQVPDNVSADIYAFLSQLLANNLIKPT